MPILEHIITARDRSWEWFKKRAHGPHAVFWLVLLSFVEPIFSFIVPEALMVAMLLADSKHWKRYAAITSVASVAGGIAGYLIGAFLFNSVGEELLAFSNLEDEFVRAQAVLGAHIFLTMFLVSFTPIPDKVFVLAAGFLGAGFVPYIAGYIAGRVLRFYLVAYFVHRFGTSVLALLEKYFMRFAIVAGVIILAILLKAFVFPNLF